MAFKIKCTAGFALTFLNVTIMFALHSQWCCETVLWVMTPRIDASGLDYINAYPSGSAFLN